MSEWYSTYAPPLTDVVLRLLAQEEIYTLAVTAHSYSAGYPFVIVLFGLEAL